MQVLRPDSRIVGEGYSILRMLPNSFTQNKALLSVPASAEPAQEGVALADISLWNADCGNEAGVMLAWEAGAASTVHDLNMLVSVSVLWLCRACPPLLLRGPTRPRAAWKPHCRLARSLLCFALRSLSLSLSLSLCLSL